MRVALGGAARIPLKILVKLDHFPKVRGENKKVFKLELYLDHYLIGVKPPTSKPLPFTLEYLFNSQIGVKKNIFETTT